MSTRTDNHTPAFGLSHDSFGHLVMIDAEGVRYVGVEPIRGFPISDREHWVTIIDSEGREICCIENLADLPAATRQVLEDELAHREFVPQIQRIVAATMNVDPSQWDVETDRGRTAFLLNSEDDVRRVAPHCYLICDSAGGRYMIRETRKLDAHSRKLLDRYL
jgi:hypothetical protein